MPAVPFRGTAPAPSEDRLQAVRPVPALGRRGPFRVLGWSSVAPPVPPSPRRSAPGSGLLHRLTARRPLRSADASALRKPGEGRRRIFAARFRAVEFATGGFPRCGAVFRACFGLRRIDQLLAVPKAKSGASWYVYRGYMRCFLTCHYG